MRFRASTHETQSLQWVSFRCFFVGVLPLLLPEDGAPSPDGADPGSPDGAASYKFQVPFGRIRNSQTPSYPGGGISSEWASTNHAGPERI